MSAANNHLAAQRMLPVTEEEVQRIILDIHDGPVQKLFAALTQMHVLQARVEQGSATAADWQSCLQRVNTLVEASLGELRVVLGTLRSPEFARRNVRQILHGLILQHSELTGMHVQFRVAGEIPPLALPVKIVLYRITQEALSNVYRHAGANQAAVHLSAQGNVVQLQVTDNGRGFMPPPLDGPNATERVENIGLRGMRERLSLVGGKLTVKSSPSRGTSILVEVPADESAPE